MVVERRFSWNTSPVGNRQVWRPPTDVWETEDAIVVRVEIAGMEEKDFNVQLNRRRLIISGKRHDQSTPCKLAYQQMEIMYGDFVTEVFLPWAANPEEVEATYQNGFLTVLLPKPKKHQVKLVDAQ